MKKHPTKTLAPTSRMLMNKILKYFIMAIGMLAIGCLGVKNSPFAYYFTIGCYCQAENSDRTTFHFYSRFRNDTLCMGEVRKPRLPSVGMCIYFRSSHFKEKACHQYETDDRLWLYASNGGLFKELKFPVLDDKYRRVIHCIAIGVERETTQNRRQVHCLR